MRFNKIIGDGFYLAVNHQKADCTAEMPHWHLCKGGQEIGKIWIKTYEFAEIPEGVPEEILEQAIAATRQHASYVKNIYDFNAFYGD
ncbi:hypothetical protein IK112_00155 [Candidatus Saccharibacteria bacterium]|nr:hypothetical protein [Candidatus Saccharibacteria bacterium]